MHAIKDKPVVVNGEIVIRPIMVVALTYDHRLLDGREAVTFLGEYSFFLWIRVLAAQVRWHRRTLPLPANDDIFTRYLTPNNANQLRFYSEGQRVHRRPKEDASCLTVDNNSRTNNTTIIDPGRFLYPNGFSFSFISR